jgi:hypothetical protein
MKYLLVIGFLLLTCGGCLESRIDNERLSQRIAKTGGASNTSNYVNNSGNVIWGQTLTAGSSNARFRAVWSRNLGKVVAVGYQSGTTSYSYGTVSATGSASGSGNALIVQYDQSGNAEWARSTLAGDSFSTFNAVAADSSGNLYAAGYLAGAGSYTFGSQTVSGPDSTNNVVIVKYDGQGNVIWASSASSGPGNSQFNGLTTDPSNNIIAVGSQVSASAFVYGGTSVSGSNNSGANALIVKYNGNGTASWARSTSAGSGTSIFNAVATNSAGNIYAVGSQQTGAYTYGSQTVTGSGGANAVVVKYDSSGNTLWARTVSSGTEQTVYRAVDVDSSGNIYAAGQQSGTTAMNYGGFSLTGPAASGNAILIKYDSSGNVVWGRIVTAATNTTSFNALAIDALDNVYAGGLQNGSASVDFGGVSVSGGSASGNISLVKFDGSGAVIWARSTGTASASSAISGLSIDNSGRLFAAGLQAGTSAFTFGSVSIAGTSAVDNILLLKWE